ncbi:hypothetical protein [Streptomyces sp. NPDC015130]|uniref:hypothetical protein n=1 Tax=Streptomyces sp. NPDC015130 TaxID=3364940 RepID=UPI0036F561B9
MSGSDDGRTVGRMLRVAVPVLLLEASLTVAAKAALAEPGDTAALLDVVTHPLPLATWLGAVLLAATVVVLPTVWLSEHMAGRFGGRADLWVPAVAAAGATLPVLPRALSGGSGPTDTVGAWLTAWVVLTVAALVTRRAGGARGGRRSMMTAGG